MAFETITAGKFMKSNSLKVGESMEGFVVGKYNSEQYPEVDSLKMIINNEPIIVNPHGQLKYFFKNNNPVGFYYRFTRLEDVKTKKGAMSATWKIEIDKSKKIEIDTAPVVATTDKPATEDLPF